MAVVYEEVLQKDISSKKLCNLYILYGNDSYLKEYYSDKLSTIACTGDTFFNLQKFESNCELQEVYDAVIQYPMMADSKFVGLYDFDFQKCDKESFQKLCKIISDVEDGCVFVLRFDTVLFDVKKDSKAKKLVSLVEKSDGKVVCLDHRPIGKLVKMLVGGAQKRGCNLTESDARYIVERVGEDINLLKNELDKLCAFVKTGDIDRKTIDTVCVKTIDASMYDFVDFIVSGNLSGALKILDDMFFMRVEPMAILFSVSSVYVDMYRVFEGQKFGKQTDDIAKDFDYGNRKFVITKTIPKLRKFDLKRLNESFEIILKTDKALKSFGGNERQILEKMTVDLSAVLWGEF